jgi:predicted permease
LPFDEPERLVVLHASQPTIGETRRNVSAAYYRDWTEDNPVFAGAGAYTWWDYNFQSADEPDRISGCPVTAGLFPLLGVEPLLGRHFLPEEDRPGGPLVALISHTVWTQRFASDPRIVGRTVRLDGEVREIVGVMPKGFRFSHFGEIWTPLQLDTDATPRESRQAEVIARLRPGTSLSEAQAAMTARAESLASLHPDTDAGWTVDVTGLREAWMPATASGKLAMAAQLVLVACVLLIVCANITNVVLAQATGRQQERALRAALGASRGRLIRQTLVESTVLALGGGVLGALLASWTDVAFQSMVPIPLPYWLDLQLEPHGLVYILIVTLAAGVAIGLLPAIRSSGRFLFDGLRNGGGGEDRGSSWLRRGLVVGEYAIVLVILVAGLLMMDRRAGPRRRTRSWRCATSSTTSRRFCPG